MKTIRILFTTALLLAGAAAVPASAAAAATTATVHLTYADNGRQLTVDPGTEVQVDLAPQRAGDVWQPYGGSDMHALSESTSGSSLSTRVNATTSLTARTDAACAHGSPACAYNPLTWSVHVDVTPGPVPDNPAPAACDPQPATPAAGIRIVTPRDNGRGVTVHQGDVVVVDLPCGQESSVDPWTLPTADGPLFRVAARGASDLHDVQVRFSTESTGRSTLQWTTDVRCTPSQGQVYCFGRPSQLLRVQVAVVAPGTPIGARDDQCVQSLEAPAAAIYGSTVRLTGQADPGATVRVYSGKDGQPAYSLRRTLVADGAGRYATSYVADAQYDVYAAAGTACRTAARTVALAPRITGPARATRGGAVTLKVQGRPQSSITISFRRQGQNAFVVRRRGRLDAAGRYTTAYVADADYRYLVQDLTQNLAGNAGLTQLS